jgi:hypothetical protein
LVLFAPFQAHSRAEVSHEALVGGYGSKMLNRRLRYSSVQ